MPMTDPVPYQVTADWLADNLVRVIILDATFFLPGSGRDADKEFEKQHIPGAQRFDVNKIADDRSFLPHMMPSAFVIEDVMEQLGIETFDHIVCYDQVGIFSAPRAWWMLRSAGCTKVSILSGGMPAWLKSRGDTESGPARPVKVRASADTAPRGFADRHDVLKALKSETQIIDARPADRFRGEAPEPRGGLTSGHMPGAINIPFTSVLDENGGLKEGKALKKVFADAGVDLSRPVITTCGSGVSAAVISWAMASVGTPSRIYDGSWAEWGQPELELPVATG